MPDTALVGEAELAKFPLPVKTLHCPVPFRGVVAPRFAEVEQVKTSEPAMALTEEESIMMVTSLVEVQFKLVVVHLKTLAPTVMFRMSVVGLVGLTIFPFPETKDQRPVPTLGVLANICVLSLKQMVWLDPAMDGVGPSF